MATKTFYLVDTLVAGGHLTLQDGGSPPSQVRLSTGWVVGTATPTKYARMDSQTERAVGWHSGSAQPDGPPDPIYGDCFRSDALNGTFASGSWSFGFEVEGETRVTSTHDGRLRVRVWKSTNPTGTSATELTTATLSTSQYIDLANSAFQNISGSVGLNTFTFNNEYLFVQIAHQLDGAGGNVNCDTHLAIGPKNLITTPNFAGVAQTVTLSTLSLEGFAETLTVSAPISPQTVPLSTLNLAGLFQTSNIIPGAKSVSLLSLLLKGSIPSLSIIPGAKSIPINTIGLSSLLLGLTVNVTSPGQNVSLSTLSLSGLLQSSSIVPGAKSVSVSSLNLSSSAISLSITVGAKSIALSSLFLLGKAIALTVYSGGAPPNTVSLNTLLLSGNAIHFSIVPGGKAVDLSTLSLLSSQPKIFIIPGAIIINLATLSLLGKLEALSVSTGAPPGAVVIPLNTLDLQSSLIALLIAVGTSVVDPNVKISSKILHSISISSAPPHDIIISDGAA